jgi:hypothetical protein
LFSPHTEERFFTVSEEHLPPYERESLFFFDAYKGIAMAAFID